MCAGMTASAVAVIWLQALALGQTCANARVLVTVQDSAGARVPGARADLLSNTVVAASKQTGPDGLAAFDGLACGSYGVKVTKNGFDPLEGGSVALLGAAPVEMTATLHPASPQHQSIEVHASAPEVEQSSSASQSVRTDDVKNLPSRPATVSDALPLLPGIVRAPDGSLKLNGSGEHRSALVVNKADVTDPATGNFGQTVPVDSIEEMNVFKTPFLAQFGRFTSSVVSVETKRGGDKWHSELNDPLPDFRFRSWHMVGLRDASPRGVLNGAIVPNRLYFAETLLYDIRKTPNRTLPYPYNESKQETINSFTQLDYILSPRQLLTATFHVTPQHINFVDPQYFLPEPVTPSYHQQEYVGTFAHHLAIGGGTLDSTMSFQRFDGVVGAQGAADMILTPTGDSGNYFAGQNREAGRNEWLESWSPVALAFAGTHELKFGSVVAGTSNDGLFTARPVSIFDTYGTLLERITYTNGGPYNRTDLETALFAQDHWAIRPNLMLDIGSRLERQNIAESFRIAPRFGFAWLPFSGRHTVVRGGYGVFYDRVPLNVYAFGRYPEQIVTQYAPGGGMLGAPLTYLNVIGTVPPAESLLIHGANEPGSFAPHSATWDVQVEHTLARLVRLRASYTDSQASGLILLQPAVTQTAAALLLNGTGHSRYRQAEITARFSWIRSEFFLAYTRSRAEGDLNDFNTFLGNFPSPLIRPNLYTLAPSDLPNRFLAWGHVSLPYRMQIMPVIEYRNGFPYANTDVLGNYLGVPYTNSTRYPNFFSLDARLSKDIKIGKYTYRFSVGCMNITDHFNALAIHANIADPQYGLFFGTYPRRLVADFDVLF